MTAYRVVAEQDDESLVFFCSFEKNRLVDAVYEFGRWGWGQPKELVLLQELRGNHWQTVDWREQKEN